MNLLPLVQREFTVASRRSLTWWLRVLVGTVAGTCFLLATAAARNPAQLGQGLFATLAVIAFVLAALAGTRYAAIPLCEENRENTLGLLLLTPLRRFEVVLGRLAGAVLESAGALAALVPVLTLALLAGGVTFSQVWMAAMALTVVLLLSNAIGLYVAAIRTNDLQVMLFSALLTAAACLPFCWMLLGIMLTAELDARQQRETVGGRRLSRWAGAAIPLLWVTLLGLFTAGLALQSEGAMIFFASPAYLLFLALTGGSLALFALSTAGSCWIIGFFVWLTGTRLAVIDMDEREREAAHPIPAPLPVPSVAQDQSTPPRFTGESFPPRGHFRHRLRPKELLNRNPIVWLLHLPEERRRLIWAAAIAIGLAGLYPVALAPRMGRLVEVLAPLLAPFVVVGYLLSPVFGFLVAWHAARLFAEARKSGSLELLLVTPGFRTAAISSIWRSLKANFGGPVVLILTLTYLGTINALAFHDYAPGDFSPLRGLATQGVGTVAQLLGLLALAWLGIWQSWRSPRPTMAAFKAFFLAGVLPWILFVPVVGFSVRWWRESLAVNVLRLLLFAILIAYARRRLKGTFLAGAPPVEQRRT